MKRKRLKITIIDADHTMTMQHDEYVVTPSYEIAKLLAKHGHKITMLSSKSQKRRNNREDNVTTYELGVVTPFHWISRISFFIKLPFVVRNIRGDIILEYFSGNIPLQITPLITNIPVIGIPKIFSSNTPGHGLNAIVYPVERLRLRLYKYVIAYTKDIESMMKTLNAKCMVRYIPLGIGKEYLSLKRQPSEYILFLGKFNMEKKGIDVLLRSFSKIKRQVKYPLMLAGHGKDEMKIRKLIKKLRLEKRVILAGPTYGDKKISVLAKALFLAYPVRFDDVPVVSLEAIASGLPTVSFDIPELSWTEEAFSLKAIPYDETDYARLLRYAAESPDIEHMREAARKFSRKLSRDRIAKKYEEYLYEILKQNKPNR